MDYLKNIIQMEKYIGMVALILDKRVSIRWNLTVWVESFLMKE